MIVQDCGGLLTWGQVHCDVSSLQLCDLGVVAILLGQIPTALGRTFFTLRIFAATAAFLDLPLTEQVPQHAFSSPDPGSESTSLHCKVSGKTLDAQAVVERPSTKHAPNPTVSLRWKFTLRTYA